MQCLKRTMWHGLHVNKQEGGQKKEIDTSFILHLIIFVFV